MEEYKGIDWFLQNDQFSSRVIPNDHVGMAALKGELLPKSLTFGNIVAGSQSAGSIITVRNVGWKPLPIEAINLPSDFIGSTNCPVGGELGVGGVCEISVAFAPQTSGLKSGGLYVDTGNAQGSEFVQLIGYGVPSGKGLAGLSASSLAFGTVAVGASDTKTFTITNNGEADLTVNAITASGEFSVTSYPTAPKMLVPGTSMTVSVKFTPISKGAKAGAISISHDGAGSTSVALTGTASGEASGLPIISISAAIIEAYSGNASVTASTTSLSFDAADVGSSSAAKTVLLTNSGLVDAKITLALISNTDDFTLSMDANALGGKVPAGGTASFMVKFTPKTAGARTATLTIKTDAATGSNFIVSASGTANQGKVDLPRLAISGNQFVLADNPATTVRLKSVNWFGAESNNYTPHGTWVRPWKAILDDIKSMGFNCIRLPFSGDVTTSGRTPPAAAIDSDANPDLVGKNSLEILDMYFDYCNEIGIYVVLDHHRRVAGDGTDGSPVDGSYTETSWHNSWGVMARRYANHPAIVGADLHNEPHNLTWDQWATYAEGCGNYLIPLAPKWLYFVQGVASNSDGTTTWWGGALKDVATRPVVLSTANKVAYSPHEYGQSVGSQTWLSTDSNAVSGYPGNLYAVWDANWGFIFKNNIAPLWIGEFGGHFGVDGSGSVTKPNGTPEKQWVSTLITYLNGDFNGDGTSDIASTKKGLSFAYWSYNPNSGDTGGLVQDDWTTHQTVKLGLLAPALN